MGVVVGRGEKGGCLQGSGGMSMYSCKVGWGRGDWAGTA